jgi:hypothetical protein
MAKVSRRTRGPALSVAEADQSYEATHGIRREYVRTLRRSSAMDTNGGFHDAAEADGVRIG